MKQKEKLETMTTAMEQSIRQQATGDFEEKTVKTQVDKKQVEKIIGEWPDSSKKAVHHTMKKYGPPNEATQSRLVWYNSGPWKRTVIRWDEIPHNFPVPHVDTMEQFIDYHVPLDKYNDIAKFDGSVIVERTRGEVSARCDSEAANFITINLMHEIVTGKMSVEEAKEAYGEAVSAYAMNNAAPYAEGFTFEVPTSNTKDFDEVKIASAMMKETVEKVKNKIS